MRKPKMDYREFERKLLHIIDHYLLGFVNLRVTKEMLHANYGNRLNAQTYTEYLMRSDGVHWVGRAVSFEHRWKTKVREKSRHGSYHNTYTHHWAYPAPLQDVSVETQSAPNDLPDLTTEMLSAFMQRNCLGVTCSIRGRRICLCGYLSLDEILQTVKVCAVARRYTTCPGCMRVAEFLVNTVDVVYERSILGEPLVSVK